MNWSEFWEIILGEMTLETFAAYFVLMLAGAIIIFTADVRRGVKKSEGKFSWGYMFADNLFRILSVVLIIAVAVIFYESFFGVPLNAKLALMQGLSIDALVGTVTKAGKDKAKATRAKLKAKFKA